MNEEKIIKMIQSIQETLSVIIYYPDNGFDTKLELFNKTQELLQEYYDNKGDNI